MADRPLPPTAAIDIDRRLATARILHPVLIDLIDLSLQGKQAHWNLRGRMFRELHLLLDEVVDGAREAADVLAERSLALGVAADGRASTIVEDSHLDPFPGGRVEDHQVVELIAARLLTVSESGRSSLHKLEELDPVSADLVSQILAVVEKHLWMIESHKSPEP